MSRTIRRFAVVAAVLSVTLAVQPRGAQAAWPNVPSVNVPVCTATLNQTNSRTCSDGAGGLIATWEDRRSGSPRIYAQRVTAAGVAAWTANGVQLSLASSINPAILADGAGGAYVGWGSASEIYVTHITSSGALSAGWPAGGMMVSDGFTSSTTNRVPLVGDGSGGAFVVWEELGDLVVTRLTSAGTVAGGWTAGGDHFSTGVFVPSAISDGAGGLFAAFSVIPAADFNVNVVRITGAATVSAGWPAGGLGVGTGVGDDLLPVLAPDGSGGAIVAWQNGAGIPGGNILASRITGTGFIPPGWNAPTGITVCGAAGSQNFPVIAPDNTGGAYISWTDPRGGIAGFLDVYVTHVTGAGTLVAGWPADGLGVHTTSTTRTGPTLSPDGSGGVYAAYDDSTMGFRDVLLQRVLTTGVLATGWPAGGRVVCSAASRQQSAQVISDGNGGALVLWEDYRNGGNADQYAQRVDRFSRIGNPEPAIASVRDIPNDQGGQVKVSWNASYLDADPFYEIDNYRVLRSVPPNAAMAAIRDGARLLSAADQDPGPGLKRFLVMELNGTAYYWELLATLTALQISNYSYTAATEGDSVGGSNPRTAFMIQARTAAGTQWWFSAPDSGYSVDNVAPAPPAAFSAQYFPGTAPASQRGVASATVGHTWLHWSRSPEPDFAEYRVYRGATPDFPLGSGTLVVTQSDTGYIDFAGAPYFYKLAAVDTHGNLSVASATTPTGTTGVGDPGWADLVLGPMYPNPMRESASLVLSLPREAEISLAVYDAAGRRIAQIARGRMPAGPHTLRWEGRDELGHSAKSGIYFLRLEAEGRVLTRRLAVAR